MAKSQETPRPPEQIVKDLRVLRGHGTTDLAARPAGRRPPARPLPGRPAHRRAAVGLPGDGPRRRHRGGGAVRRAWVVAPEGDSADAEVLAAAVGAKLVTVAGPSDIADAFALRRGLSTGAVFDADSSLGSGDIARHGSSPPRQSARTSAAGRVVRGGDPDGVGATSTTGNVVVAPGVVAVVVVPAAVVVAPSWWRHRRGRRPSWSPPVQSGPGATVVVAGEPLARRPTDERGRGTPRGSPWLWRLGGE